MSAGTIAIFLVFGLTVSAVVGPRVLRQSAPALMRAPRLAIALLTGTAVTWVLALLALGPMLAWVVTGPAVLPGGVAEVCQQCLAAANPFTSKPIETIVPIAALILLPAIAALLQGIAITRELRRRHRNTLRSAIKLKAWGVTGQLHGYPVLITKSNDPFALALPQRYGGIVVSTAALDVLVEDELLAVLAHEQAHIRQRHHLITGFISSLIQRLRWVPLLAAVEDALAHYVEIAADDVARRTAGTPALASALLTLSQNRDSSAAMQTMHGALHVIDKRTQVLGPDRVRRIVHPRRGMAGVISATVGISCLAFMVLLSAVVHIPYAFAALSGCV